MQQVYECAIIGGGPAGITAVLYALRSGLRTAWIEKFAPGGQMLMTEAIMNYPGFPKGIKGYELADLFAVHVTQFDVDKYEGTVTVVEHTEKVNRLCIGEKCIEARSVIVSSGVECRKLGLPREKELVGHGLSYCALCDGAFFRDQVVGVVGGGNAALEETLYLTKLVDKVYLIHRRSNFRGAQRYQDKVIAHRKVEVLYNCVVEELLGDPNLTGVRLRNVCTTTASILELAGLFVFIGSSPTVSFVPKDLNLDADGFILTDAEMRTNLSGIFAAGDCRSKLCRQVCTAVGDGATAANTAVLYLEQFHD